MKKLIYFVEYIIISLFFIICKFLGYKFASNLGFFVGKSFLIFLEAKKSIIQNLKNQNSNKNFEDEFSKNVLAIMEEYYLYPF